MLARAPSQPAAVSSLKRIVFRERSIPVALLLLGLVCFGLLIPWLGFYWDDWPGIWFLHLLGPAGFKDVFTVDRPVLGLIFTVTSFFIRDSIVGWQVFGILTRWLTCLAVWWLLRGVWPQHSRPVAFAVLLFAIYPGFKQQAISMTYANAWILAAMFYLTLGAFVWALRLPRWRWLLLAAAWLLGAVVMFTDEYYFGLYLLAPVFAWLIFSEQTRGWRLRLGRTLLVSAPYLAMMVVFVIWRVLLSSTPRGQVTVIGSLRQNPLATLVALAGTVLQDVFEAGGLAWLEPFNPLNLRGHALVEIGIFAGILLLTGLATWLYLSRWQSSDTTETNASRNWALTLAGVGLFALLVGGIPFWMTDLPIKLKFPWDRFTLAMMLGACLLLVGLLEMVRSPRLQILALAVLFGVSAGAHFLNNLTYQREWAAQKAFFWQLTWRIPALKPGTTLLTADLPFRYYSDNSLTGPLNDMYAPGLTSRQMPYLLYDLGVRLNNGLPGLQPGLPIHQGYRATAFDGSTSQMVVFYAGGTSCLKVLDPALATSLPARSRELEAAIPLSNLENILPAGQARPPASIFGPEPPHGWCYFYEKAELARQQGDWAEVARLGQAGLPLFKISTENAAEAIPFILGYAHLTQWDLAVGLALQAAQAAPKDKHAVCAAWRTLEAGSVPEKVQQTMVGRLDCP